MSLGVSKTIFYFNSEGKQNLKKTVELVVKRAIESEIKHIIVFTSDGEGALMVKDKLDNFDEINVYAATFPYNQVFYSKDKDGNPKEVLPKMSSFKVREFLEKRNVKVIQGVMPLQDMIIPGAPDPKIQAINHTLSIVSGGLRLCIQAILMAADGGFIDTNEKVIAMSADTAIVAKSSLTTWIFHPNNGLEINEIICKPNRLTITRSDTK